MTLAGRTTVRKPVIVDHCPYCLRALGVCRIPSCDRDSYSRGLCKAHYTRLRRYGNVEANVPIRSWGAS